VPLHAGHDDGKSLSVLVPEVLECVCAYVRPADLKSMRLVSRKMNDIALRLVLSIVHFDLLPASFDHLPASFDQLNKISTHAVLSRHIRTLRYFPIQFHSCRSLAQFKQFVLESLENYMVAEVLDVASPKDLKLSGDEWRKHYDEHEHQCHI